jgi:phosphoglycolate phosphatase
VVDHDRGVMKLACLDLAGTLVTDDAVVEGAFLTALGSVSDLDEPEESARARELVRSSMGRHKADVFLDLLGDERLARRAVTAFEAGYDIAVARGEVQRIPGADDALRALHERGVRLCVTTGFSATTRDMLLDAMNWTERFDLALSPSDAGRGRPFPDMVLTAALRLGIEDVRQIATVGDTTNDLLAGTRAGAGMVVGVLSGAHDRATLATVPHTHIVDSIADVPALVAEHNAQV